MKLLKQNRSHRPSAKPIDLLIAALFTLALVGIVVFAVAVQTL